MPMYTGRLHWKFPTSWVNVVLENHSACASVPIMKPLMASTLDHANQ
jgi:hypothetical protein